MHRRATLVLRILVGAIMLVTGTLKFVKPDFKTVEDATLQAFIDTGWLWQLIGAAEVVGGAMLFSKRFAPLGLAVLAPVVAGILAFALKVGGEETSVGLLLAVFHVYLAWQMSDSFRSLIQPPRTVAS
jgi:uncharacterized membrane protein YphA (DoxX/SURF4 family)